MRKITACFLSVFITLSCLSQQYRITATITGFPDGTQFYLQDLDTNAPIDSTVIKHNALSFTGHLDHLPGNFWVCTHYNKEFYYVTLLMGNDNLSIKGDIKDFPFDLSVTGSRIQDGFNTFNILTRDQLKARNRLLSEYFALKGDSAEIKGKAIWEKINILDSTNIAIQKAFVRSHPGTYAAVQALFFLRKQFGRDSVRYIYESMNKALQQSTYGGKIASYLKVGEPVKKGDHMVDFEAFDKNNKPHRLSDYAGKYILLDFSTTYCGPCIQSLKDLKKLSAAYPDSLSVISLSGDADKKTWLTGLDRDQPTWPSLWDGMGVSGEAMLKYDVGGFPTFCLIDPQGKILKRWVGYGTNKDGSGTVESTVTKMMGK